MSFERWERLLRDYEAAKATADGHGKREPRRGPADDPGAVTEARASGDRAGAGPGRGPAAERGADDGK